MMQTVYRDGWLGASNIKSINVSGMMCSALYNAKSSIVLAHSLSPSSRYNFIITGTKICGNGRLSAAIISDKGKICNKTIIPICVDAGKQRKYSVVIQTPDENTKFKLKIFQTSVFVGVVAISSILMEELPAPTRPLLLSSVKQEAFVFDAKAQEKIVYFVSRIEQRRVFQNFKEVPGVKQYFVGPPPRQVYNNIGVAHENYDQFLLKNIINATQISEYQNIINSIRPDIFVCGTLPNFGKIILPKKTKRVFVSHGMVGDHASQIVEISKYSNSWKYCSLYLGAGHAFEKFISFMTKKQTNNVVSNILPQLDILFNMSGGNLFKEKLASKYILFAGFAGNERSDFRQHNEDYYRTAIFLERLARKNNWFIMIKPRLEPDSDLRFIKNNTKLNHYYEEYESIYKSDHVCMVHRLENIYKYFFADVVVCNGCSTVEIEACCAGKPLVLVRTASENYDPFKTERFGAARMVNKDTIDCLEDAILSSVVGEKQQNVEALLKYHNIVFDGKMSDRAQEAILSLL